jgi:hypothetical protein
MSFSVANLAKTLESLPPKERKAMESKLLADYARQAAFARPLDMIGLSRIYEVSAGLEELSLSQDADIVSVNTQEEFEQAMNKADALMLLIRSGAKISDLVLAHTLEHSVQAKTIFKVK